MITKRSWLLLACCLALMACRSTRKNTGSAGTPPAFGGESNLGGSRTAEKDSAEHKNSGDAVADVRIENGGARDSSTLPRPDFPGVIATDLASTNNAAIHVAEGQVPGPPAKQAKDDEPVVPPRALDVPIAKPDAGINQPATPVDEPTTSVKPPVLSSPPSVQAVRAVPDDFNPAGARSTADDKMRDGNRPSVQAVPLVMTTTQPRLTTNHTGTLPLPIPPQADNRVSRLVGSPQFPNVAVVPGTEKATPSRLRIWDGLGAASRDVGQHQAGKAIPISVANESRAAASRPSPSSYVSLDINTASNRPSAPNAPPLRVDPVLDNDAARWRAQQLERQAADQRAREEEWINFRRILQQWLKPPEE